MSVYLSIYPSISLSICRSIYLSIYLSVCLSACLSVCLSICKLENDASLRDFVHFLNLATSKTKQVCETSSIFELDNAKNVAARLPQFSKLTRSKTKQFWETSFKNGKLSAKLTASCQCVLRFFHSICLKHCVCHGKVRPGHTKCCTCHAKSY